MRSGQPEISACEVCHEKIKGSDDNSCGPGPDFNPSFYIRRFTGEGGEDRVVHR